MLKFVEWIFAAPPAPVVAAQPIAHLSWALAITFVCVALLGGAKFFNRSRALRNDDYFKKETKNGRVRYYKWVYSKSAPHNKRVKRRVSKREWLRVQK